MATTTEAIAAFKVKQDEFNARLATAVEGVEGDVLRQKALIEQLQNNPGPISPEDQAILDQLQSVNESLVSRVESVDALTPPPPPVES